MSNFILYVPEKGICNGNGEVCVPFTELHEPWNLSDSSVEALDLGDMLCLIEKRETFYHVIRELWRCAKKGAPINMNIPHPRHDLFLSNPEYCRPILPETLEKFNSELNDKWKALGLSHPRLGHRLEVHFEITTLQMNADPYWQDLLQKQQIGPEDLNLASKQASNVVTHMQITWAARKTLSKAKSDFHMAPEMIAQFEEQILAHKKSGNLEAAVLVEDMVRKAKENR